MRKLLSFQIAYFVIAFGAWAVFLFSMPFDPDYTSGELWDHVMSWMESGQLYPLIGEAPYRVMNYPPLFPWLVRGLMELGLSPLLAGRIINLAGFVLAIGVLYQWSRRVGTSQWGSFVIVSMTAASMPLLYSSGQFHIELLATAFSLLGLYHISQADRAHRIIIGGGLVVLAVFVKQTQVIGLIIALVWIWQYRRRFLPQAMLSVVLCGLLGIVVLTGLFGTAVWHHLVTYTVGTYSSWQLGKQLLFHLGPWLIFFLLGLLAGWNERGLRSDLRWWYFIGTSLWLLASARNGSGHQYFVEWSLATLIWVGPWLMRETAKTWVTILLGVQLITGDLAVAGLIRHHVHDLDATRVVLPSICQGIAGAQELIPSESAGIVRACGQRPALHPFIMTSLARRQLWDQRPFLDSLEQALYPRLLLPFDPALGPEGVNAERWTDEMIAVMRKSYRVSGQYHGWYVMIASTH